MSASKFIHNLYTTLNDPRWSPVIAWHPDGGFVIKDPVLFERHALSACGLASTMKYFKSQLTRHQFDPVVAFDMRYKQRGNLFAAGRTDLLARLVELGRVKRTRTPKRARRPHPGGSEDDEEDAGDDYVPTSCGCSHDCTLTRYEMSAAKKKIATQNQTIALLRTQLAEKEEQLVLARAAVHETATNLAALAKEFAEAVGRQPMHHASQTLAAESAPSHVPPPVDEESSVDEAIVFVQVAPSDTNPAALGAPVPSSPAKETSPPPVALVPTKATASPPVRVLPTLPPPSVLVLPPTSGPLVFATQTDSLFTQEQSTSTAACLTALDIIMAPTLSLLP